MNEKDTDERGLPQILSGLIRVNPRPIIKGDNDMTDKKTREILNAQGAVGSNLVEVDEVRMTIGLLNELIA
ncbi:MAG: hypothetical protein KC449_30995, partial [Anaerolineales bacterium]|nr:hypothetical protein [Anaerolineales bacterium]